MASPRRTDARLGSSRSLGRHARRCRLARARRSARARTRGALPGRLEPSARRPQRGRDLHPGGSNVNNVAPSPEHVSSELRRWLEERFGGAVEDSEPPTRVSGGFDFWIYFMRFRGSVLPDTWTQPLVARIPPTPARTELLKRESRLQSWVSDHGYSAPGVLALLPPEVVCNSPVQVVQRVPGVTMTAAMTARPWR